MSGLTLLPPFGFPAYQSQSSRISGRNGFDLNAVMATFAETALVNDQHREYRLMQFELGGARDHQRQVTMEVPDGDPR
jgi:hypothetical protein